MMAWVTSRVGSQAIEAPVRRPRPESRRRSEGAPSAVAVVATVEPDVDEDGLGDVTRGPVRAERGSSDRVLPRGQGRPPPVDSGQKGSL